MLRINAILVAIFLAPSVALANIEPVEGAEPIIQLDPPASTTPPLEILPAYEVLFASGTYTSIYSKPCPTNQNQTRVCAWIDFREDDKEDIPFADVPYLVDDEVDVGTQVSVIAVVNALNDILYIRVVAVDE